MAKQTTVFEESHLPKPTFADLAAWLEAHPPEEPWGDIEDNEDAADYVHRMRRQRCAMCTDNDEIPAEELAALEQMANLSDDELWVAAREQMPAVQQARIAELLPKNSRGTITDEESAELAVLIVEGDKLMLRKSYAMGYLMDRGYKVTLDDLKPEDEDNNAEDAD